MKVKKFNELFEKNTFKYEYGCLMLKLDVPNWNKDVLNIIDKDDIYDEPGYGLEKETHITIFFGIFGDIDYKDVKEKMKGISFPEYIELKNISIFENSDTYDVVKFDIDDKNNILTNIHYFIKDIFPSKTTFEYHPHCTIAYVKRGKGIKYIQELEKPLIVKPSKLYYTYPKNNGESKGEVDIIKF